MCHGNHCFLNLCISQYARQSKWFMEQWDKFSAFFCHFEQQLHCRKKFIQCIGEKSCVIVWIPLLLETRLCDTSTNYCVVPEIYSFLGGSRNLGPILNTMEKRYLVRNWDCFQFLIWLLHCVVMVLQHFTFFTSLKWWSILVLASWWVPFANFCNIWICLLLQVKRLRCRYCKVLFVPHLSGFVALQEPNWRYYFSLRYSKYLQWLQSAVMSNFVHFSCYNFFLPARDSMINCSYISQPFTPVNIIW